MVSSPGPKAKWAAGRASQDQDSSPRYYHVAMQRRGICLVGDPVSPSAERVSLAGAVAPRAEARARVGFGPGGLAVRWRSFVRVEGRRRTPPARRPRLAREGGPRA